MTLDGYEVYPLALKLNPNLANPNLAHRKKVYHLELHGIVKLGISRFIDLLRLPQPFSLSPPITTTTTI